MLRNFKFRIIICFCLIITLFFTCITRIFIINNSGYSSVAAQNNTHRFRLAPLRRTVFDCNMQPITNSDTKTVAVFTPCETAVAMASNLKNSDDRKRILESLRKGVPVFSQVDSPIDAFGVYCTEVYVNTPDNLLCPQLIGYLDSESHGVTGIQKEYDEWLYSTQSHSVTLPIDALGNVLSGEEIREEFDSSVISSGIALTINSDIQRLTLAAMKNVTSGAAVITELGTGKLRAMVSVPEFDAANISDYLEMDNSPFLNKCISAYNVGSVFKPCVAAAALEKGGYEGFTVGCVGANNIAGHTFNCHKLSGHGVTDLKNALAYSCNSFFYNISVKLGADAVYNMASALSFGTNYEIAKGIRLGGTLTSAAEIRSNQRTLVNLSIGQGKLLLSPIALLSLYEAIACGGIYYPQTVIEGKVQNGAVEKEKSPTPIRVMSEKTADILKENLKAVTEYGTGTAAKPTLTTAAGKTATAETGWEKNGVIIKNSWFCGFFPAESPKYAVAILIEDSKGGDDVAAPIFARIADSITLLENSKK